MRQTQTEAVFNGLVHCFRVGNPLLDNINGFPPQGMLQPIGYKSGNIFLAYNQLFSHIRQQAIYSLNRFFRRIFSLNDFNKGNKRGRIPKMSAYKTCFMRALISVGLMTEELVQKIVSSLQSVSSFSNTCCFSSISSKTASTTTSTVLQKDSVKSLIK